MRRFFFFFLFLCGCARTTSIQAANGVEQREDPFSKTRSVILDVKSPLDVFDSSKINVRLTAVKDDSAKVLYALNINWFSSDWPFFQRASMRGDRRLVCRRSDSQVLRGGRVVESITCLLSRSTFEALKVEGDIRLYGKRFNDDVHLSAVDIEGFLSRVDSELGA